MGGEGSGRKPDVVRMMAEQNKRPVMGVNELNIPNYSGLKTGAKKTDTDPFMPKSYIDSQISGENHWDDNGTQLQPYISTKSLKITGTGDSSFAGNVGIGTTGPNAQLHVLTTGTGTTIATQLRLENNANGGSGQIYSPALDFTTSNSNVNARVYATREGGTGGNLVLQTATTAGILTDRVYIKNDGNVGIGTTSPNAKLEVTGDVIIDLSD